MATEDARRDGNKVPVMLGWTGSEIIMLRVTPAGDIRMAHGGTPEHHNGTAPSDSFAAVNFSGACSSFTIHNTDGSNNLLISFDAGVTFFTLEVGAYWEKALSISTLSLKGSGGTATYEIVAVV